MTQVGRQAMEIVATGMVTPAGFNAAAGFAALRAGVTRFAELPYYDLQGEPIVGAAVQDLTENFESDERMVATLLALRICCARSGHFLWSAYPCSSGFPR